MSTSVLQIVEGTSVRELGGNRVRGALSPVPGSKSADSALTHRLPHVGPCRDEAERAGTSRTGRCEA